MANYYTQFSFAITDLLPKEEAWLRERIDQENDDSFCSTLPECEFQIDRDGSRYVWIHGDTGGSDLEVLAELLQDFLRKFRPDQPIAFSWADTCSKPRLDSFGGGAVFITKEDILWMSTWSWIAEQRKEKEVTNSVSQGEVS